MTLQQVKELEKLQEEKEIYDKAIRVFDINKHIYPSKQDKERAIENAKKPFGFILNCFKHKEKNVIQVQAKGFCGGEFVEVDEEFVEMCLEYFKRKLEECDRRIEEL